MPIALIQKIYGLGIAAACVLMAPVLASEAARAQTIPTALDLWTLMCSKERLTPDKIGKLEIDIESIRNSVKAGIATLNLACAQRNHELAIYQRRLAKFQRSGKANKKPPVPVHKKSERWIRRALGRLSKNAEGKKPSVKALYHYGVGLTLIDDELAVNMFDIIMSKHEKHRLAPFAYLALGDFYLDRQDVQRALAEYKVAIRKGPKLVKIYARRKVSWAEYKLAAADKDILRQRSAVEKMASIYQMSRGDDPRFEVLARAIKEDIFALLAQIGGIKESLEILATIGADSERARLIEMMAEARLAAGDKRKAYRYYISLIKQDLTSPKNYLIAEKMARLAAQLGDVKSLAKNLHVMVRNYGRQGSKWARAQKRKVRKAAARLTEGLVFEYATMLDREGSEKKNVEYQKAAASLYRGYLKAFKKSKRATDVDFYLGQLSYQLGKYRSVAVRMLRRLRGKKKGKYFNDAAELMVLAAQSNLDADNAEYTLPDLGQAEREITLPESRKLFVDCAKLYAKVQPKSENLPIIYAAAANQLFQFGHYSAATALYHKYIKLRSDDAFAVTAASRILYVTKRNLGPRDLDREKDRIGRFAKLRQHPKLASYFAKKRSKKRGKRGSGDDDGSDRENVATEDSGGSNSNDADYEAAKADSESDYGDSSPGGEDEYFDENDSDGSDDEYEE